MTRPGRQATDAELRPRLTKREERELDTIRRHRCDLCGRALLIIEIGPHYRAAHPNDRPSVSARAPM